MAYVRKTKDRYDIETNCGYGWEVESSYYTYKEAVDDIDGYREYISAYGGSARIVKRRERICAQQKPKKESSKSTGKQASCYVC